MSWDSSQVPLEELLDTSKGSLDENLMKIASATSFFNDPTAKPHPKQNSLETVMRVPSFTSSEPALFEGPSIRKEDDLVDFVKTNAHHHSRSSLSPSLLAPFMLVSSFQR